MNYIKTAKRPGGVRYLHSETVTDATSAPVGIPASCSDVAVVVSPGSGASGKVQFTLSSPADVDADTATWADWDEGDATSIASSLIDGRVTALRLVAVGATKWEVSA